jgi:hypothetical protein
MFRAQILHFRSKFTIFLIFKLKISNPEHNHMFLEHTKKTPQAGPE